MKKLLIVIVILLTLFSGYTFYKVYRLENGVNQLGSLQVQQQNALIQIICRAHMYDLVQKPEEICKPTIDAEKPQ